MDLGLIFVLAFLGLFVGGSIYNAINRRGTVILRDINAELDALGGGGSGSEGEEGEEDGKGRER